MNVNKSRILDAGRWRPPERLVRKEVPDGRGGTRVEEYIERRPSQRHEMMLNPAGFVVPVVLGNANAISEEGKTPYYEQIRGRKIAAGFLPWGKCPVALVASQILPSRLIRHEGVRADRPCTSGNFNADNPCPHALEEQRYRREAHNAKERARAEAYKAQEDRDREQRERHHAELLAAQADGQKALAAAMEQLAGKKGKARGEDS